MRSHPDRGGSNESFIRVRWAYEMLASKQDEWQDAGEDWEGEGGEDEDEGDKDEGGEGEGDEGEGSGTEGILSHAEVDEMIGDADPPEATRAALHHRGACLASYMVLPRIDPKRGPGVKSVGLDDRIVGLLRDRGIDGFYAYQHEAIRHILGGKSVVIEAPTAFGKTEAFLAPIAQLASKMKGGRVLALFVYPTKALGRDQLPKIAAMAGALGMQAAIFDGDTMKNVKNSLVRDPPEFLVTNFDTMHKQMYMHNQLAGMLDAVKFLVVDEAHYYAGIFGANAHHIISRLKRLTGTLQCICASATLRGSGEFCSALFGQRMTVVKEAGRRSKVDMAIMSPPGGNPKRWLMVDLAKTLITHGRTPRLGATLVKTARPGPGRAEPEDAAGRGAGPAQSPAYPRKRKIMVFSNTHQNVELVGRDARLEGLRAEVHRGGLDRDRLERTEAAFQEGRLDMLSCTPTMELGVDIGNVDGVISEIVAANRFMQRVGRAGREGERGCAFLVLGGDSISRYYLEHPDEFLKDEWVPHIDVTNPDIEDIHTVAAALDRPLEGDEIKARIESTARCRTAGLLQPADRALRATELGERKVKYHSVRGIEKSVKIRMGGKTIGDRVLPMALSELHEGAIYMLGGDLYRVARLDYPRPMSATVVAMPRNARERTRALGSGWARETGTIMSRPCLGTDVALCRLRITQTINGYVHYSRSGAEYRFLDRELRHTFATKGIKFRVPSPHGITTHGDHRNVHHEASHAIEHLVASASRMIAGAAEPDIGSVLNEGGLAYIYDNVRGGNGIAGILYGRMERVLQRAYDIVATCPCKNAGGCPRCTMSYKCRSNNAGLHKDGASELLEEMLGSKTALGRQARLPRAGPPHSWFPARPCRCRRERARDWARLKGAPAAKPPPAVPSRACGLAGIAQAQACGGAAYTDEQKFLDRHQAWLAYGPPWAAYR